MQALEIHGMNLIGIKQHAKAVSLLTQALAKRMDSDQRGTRDTIVVASNLGVAFMEAKHFDAAISVMSKAWEMAGRQQSAADEGHIQLYRNYAQALILTKKHRAFAQLRAEAKSRGFRDLRVLTPEERRSLGEAERRCGRC